MKIFGMRTKNLYNNWDTQAVIIPQSLMWYRTSNLVYYLHHLRRYILNRDCQSPTLQSNHIPVAEYCRFPKDTSYMCEGIGDWNMHLDSLLMFINVIREMKPVEESGFKTIGHVELAVLEKINVLLQEITEGYHLVTRQRFEEKYKLRWSEYLILDYDVMPVKIAYVLQQVGKLSKTVTRYQ